MIRDRRLILGLVLIIIGAILILDNLRIIPYPIRYYLFSWEVIVMLIGVLLIYGKRVGTGLVLIVIGAFFLIPDMLDLSRHQWRMFWPGLLILLGLVIIFRKRLSSLPTGEDSKKDMDLLDDFTFLGGGEKIITSRNFKGGRVTTVLGGSEYKLDQATLSGEKNVIDLFVLFGGATFFVPEDWNVRVEVTPILGGFSDKRKVDPNAIPDPRKELFIKGMVLFGGGEIKNT